jgi:hypothetical protein
VLGVAFLFELQWEVAHAHFLPRTSREKIGDLASDQEQARLVKAPSERTLGRESAQPISVSLSCDTNTLSERRDLSRCAIAGGLFSSKSYGVPVGLKVPEAVGEDFEYSGRSERLTDSALKGGPQPVQRRLAAGLKASSGEQLFAHPLMTRRALS